jgi:hypothetical protein
LIDQFQLKKNLDRGMMLQKLRTNILMDLVIIEFVPMVAYADEIVGRRWANEGANRANSRNMNRFHAIQGRRGASRGPTPLKNVASDALGYGSGKTGKNIDGR